MASSRGGKLIIVGMFAVGLAAAVGAMLYRYGETRRPLEFWGRPAVVAIMSEEHVELLKFGDDGGDLVRLFDLKDGKRHPVARDLDISSARGLTNLRDSLTHDASFDFSRVPSTEPTVQYALIFGQPGTEQLIIRLDLKDGWIGHDRDQVVGLSEKTRLGLVTYFADLWPTRGEK